MLGLARTLRVEPLTSLFIAYGIEEIDRVPLRRDLHFLWVR